MKNFKFFFVVLSLFFFTTAINAQTKFGVKAGLNMATQNYTLKIGGFPVASAETSSRATFHAGAFLEMGEGRIKFRPEIMFFGKGGVISDSTENSEITTKLNYVEIPLLAKWDILDNDNLKGYLVAGLSFGSALNGKADDGDETMDIEFNEDDGYKRFDYGIPVGIGLTFDMGNGSLFVEARHTYGLKKVFKMEETEFLNFSANAKNRTNSFSVGYIMDIGK